MMKIDFLYILYNAHMGHIYTGIITCVYMTFKFNWVFCVYLLNLAAMIQ